jgi:hypothetical protein
MIRIELTVRQAAVFGEVLELNRGIEARLDEPTIIIRDRVINRGFRPTRHGLLYHINIGYPMLDGAARLFGAGWPLADRLDAGDSVPEDDHVELIDSGPSPFAGEIGIANPELGVGFSIRFDSSALPVTALWRAYQAGVYALGLEPQTVLDRDASRNVLRPGEDRRYGLTLALRPT